MPLQPGNKLGPYEILALVGKGGMGEVYRARDPRLNRDVAIKISAAQFSERFEREAKVIAALNHPNICQIYDVGPNYLVMEYITGDSPKGPVALDEVLRIARQIADALEAAHEKGITHRDLKPGNIKITPDGTVKVLDFGLAKVTGVAPASGENSPTLTIGMTEAGMILGTASYMAPEQARGKEGVDKRADIWAFGVVLYELITGQRPFQGEDVSETLAAVIKEQPDLSGVPANVRRLFLRCLEKDPKKRLRDIGDAMPLVETDSEPQKAARSWPVWVTGGMAGLFGIAAILVSFLHFRETPTEVLIQFSIPSPENSSFGNWVELSPDGKYLAYGAQKDGLPALWLRPLNSLQARPLTIENAQGAISYPFWSPDSRWIAYASDGKMKRVDIAAASPAPLVICDCVPTFRGGAWSREGVILFAPNPASAILRVSATGGTPVPVTMLDARTETLHRFPSFLPDGRHFLYIVGSADRSHSGVYVGDLEAKRAAKRILDSDSNAVFVPLSPGKLVGHLLFVKDDSLRAVPFDARRLEVTGEPTVLATGVDQVNSRGGFSASGNGMLAYWAGNAYVTPELNWYGRDGKLQGPIIGGNTVPQGALTGLNLSPDAHWLEAGLGTTAGGIERIWSFDLTREGMRSVASEKNRAVMPVWSPDSKRIAFGYSEAGVLNLFVQLYDQPNAPERLLTTASPAWPTDWSQDGGLLIYEIYNNGEHDLWALSLPDKKAHAWLHGAAQGQLAPGASDPWWMAYTSLESGRTEVYLESFTAEGRRARRVQISRGGRDPKWRGDGRELYYTSADGKLMAVEIRPGFTAGPSKELFTPPRMPFGTIYMPHRFAATLDGRRFIIATTPADQKVAPLSVIVNWQGQLRH